MAGRPTTKTPEERKQDLIAACRRSGFTGLELQQILVDWYGWNTVTITSGAVTQTVTKSDAP